MKTNMMYMAALVFAVSLGCKSSNISQSKSNKNVATSSEEKKETIGVENRENEASNLEGLGASNPVQMSNGSSGANTNMNMITSSSASIDYSQLYEDLEMTDDQIQQFRSGMEDFQNQRVKTPSGEMMGSIDSERDRQMEAILSPAQLEKFKAWKRDN